VEAPVPPPPHHADVQLAKDALAENALAHDSMGKRLECVQRFVQHRNRQLGKPLAPDELPDLAQDVVAVVWRKLGDYDGRASLETWIFRICSLELMNFARKKSRRASRRTEVGTDEDGNTSMDWVPAPGEEKSTNQDFEELYLGLSQLSTDDQAVLRRKHYDERSFEQIGHELGLKPSGVKHRYYSAVRRLRQLMSDSAIAEELTKS
jgi:RNA polymerase sigma-70 factor (ECF subfamily)